MSARPHTLGELKASGYRPRPLREELRANLRRRLAAGDPVFPGIHGYERTVIPGLVNALLAGHDFILLGLRGQAKTRLLRALTGLLDPWIPVITDSELHDDPLQPVSPRSRKLVAELGDATPVDWWPREERYQEKLATPDVTVADLLGDIDPIKAATRRLTWDDPEVIHFGLIPRSHRGIFAINELPDLAPRIQVGLLNLLEERDLQIRGFPLRLPLDVLLVFSANPEDYTNRGSIITPLKDRIASQILTHYPEDLETARHITAQEARIDPLPDGVELPAWAPDLIERITARARHSDLVDPASGVSARVSIAALELLVAQLERRRLAGAAAPVRPRLADFWSLLPALTGKFEIVYEGEEQGVELVCRQIIGQAISELFELHFPPLRAEDGSSPYADILEWFAHEGTVLLDDEQSAEQHHAQLAQVPGLLELGAAFGGDEDAASVGAEIVIEGLHQQARLAREDLDSRIQYRESLRFQLLSSHRRAREGREDIH